MIFAPKRVFGPIAVGIVAGYAFLFLGMNAYVVSDKVGPTCEDGATPFLLPASFSRELAWVTSLLRIPRNRQIHQ